mmetsp:Transcript_63796/g.198002  ORF Transcript_63796/g.198002 Transcript_63796/m.198002 type:complete len:222 (-) Transcript_63796:1216-1881(-)
MTCEWRGAGACLAAPLPPAASPMHRSTAAPATSALRRVAMPPGTLSRTQRMSLPFTRAARRGRAGAPTATPTTTAWACGSARPSRGMSGCSAPTALRPASLGLPARASCRAARGASGSPTGARSPSGSSRPAPARRCCPASGASGASSRARPIPTPSRTAACPPRASCPRRAATRAATPATCRACRPARRRAATCRSTPSSRRPGAACTRGARTRMRRCAP